MKFLLVLICLISAAEKPLPFSGEFNTIYLAGKYVSTTAENSQARILMREVKYFNQYSIMNMMFYVKKNGDCQLHTAWADKTPWQFCSIERHFFLPNCHQINGTHYIPRTWMLRDAVLHFPKTYFYPATEGGIRRRPSEFFIVIHFVSNTTILFEAEFITVGNYLHNLTGALATGTNITEEIRDKYVELTQYLRIPTKNIENVYETDTCPKWKP